MSPASQGALEVERYIGSCLITSTARPALQKSLASCRKQEQQQQQQQLALRTSKQQQQQIRPYEQQCGQFGPVGTWAGGAPLISMASNPRRGGSQRSTPPSQQQQQQQQQSQQSSQANGQQMNEQHMQHSRVPLSRLAVHTQGAPLILSGRFHNNRNKMHTAGQSPGAIANCVAGLMNASNSARSQPRSIKPGLLEQKKPQTAAAGGKSGDMPGKEASTAGTTTSGSGSNVASIDSLSIASDESSGSNNSENSLPRIIKPRKRRKKDRKPPVVSVVGTDVKTGDEVGATISSNAPVSSMMPNVVAAEQQQQPQQQQLKSYQNSPYDGGRYAADNYYKGHRRPMNNTRENAYARLHSSLNSCPVVNSANSAPTGNVPPNLPQEVIDTRQQQQQQQQQQQNQSVSQQQQQQQQSSRGYPSHRHVQVKVLDDNRNVILPVCPAKAAANYLRQHGGGGASMPSARFLHECGEAAVALACHQEPGSPVDGIDECTLQGALCQCRYCDPATLIWDVSDQNVYPRQYLATAASPADFGPGHHRHHHHHHHRFSQMPATVFLARPLICQEHANGIDLFDVSDNPCLRLRAAATPAASAALDRSDGGAILRRSWSDPTSYFSDEIVPNRDVGVIGDRGGLAGDSHKGRSSWRGDASVAPAHLAAGQSPPGSAGCPSSAPGSPGLQGPLEVSTEIVTSPNGHRDLEIKFYSSSPTSYYSSASSLADVGKSAFGPADDDSSNCTNDSEEFSDIWSYHESKLQQDFRTLLQAEE